MPRESQRSRLRNMFLARPNQWISLREILDMRIAQYNSRLLDIKRGKGGVKLMNIVNKAILIEGRTESCYKYIPEEKQGEMFQKTTTIKNNS